MTELQWIQDRVISGIYIFGSGIGIVMVPIRISGISVILEVFFVLLSPHPPILITFVFSVLTFKQLIFSNSFNVNIPPLDELYVGLVKMMVFWKLL